MCYYRNNHYVSCGHHIVIGTRPLRYCAAAKPLPQSSRRSSTTTISDAEPTEKLNTAHVSYTPAPSQPIELPSSPPLTPWPRHTSRALKTPTRASAMSLRSTAEFTPPASSHRAQVLPTLRKPHQHSHGPEKMPCNSLSQHALATFRIHNWCPSCLAQIEADKCVIEEVRDGLLRAGSVLERVLAGGGLGYNDREEWFEWDEVEEDDWRGGLGSLEEELKVLGVRIGEVGSEGGGVKENPGDEEW